MHFKVLLEDNLRSLLFFLGFCFMVYPGWTDIGRSALGKCIGLVEDVRIIATYYY
jgi:hypothetical protein